MSEAQERTLQPGAIVHLGYGDTLWEVTEVDDFREVPWSDHPIRHADLRSQRSGRRRTGVRTFELRWPGTHTTVDPAPYEKALRGRNPGDPLPTRNTTTRPQVSVSDVRGMRIRFEPVPGRFLPSDYCIALCEGGQEVVVQVANDVSLQEALEGLTDALGRYLNDAWLYVGDMSKEAPRN